MILFYYVFLWRLVQISHIVYPLRFHVSHARIVMDLSWGFVETLPMNVWSSKTLGHNKHTSVTHGHILILKNLTTKNLKNNLCRLLINVWLIRTTFFMIILWVHMYSVYYALLEFWSKVCTPSRMKIACNVNLIRILNNL